MFATRERKPQPDQDQISFGSECRPTNRPFHLIGLGVVLFVAAYLRFGGIGEAGIRFEDEAWYVSDTRLWHRSAKALVDSDVWHAAKEGDKEAFQQRLNELGVDFSSRYYKPSQGYTFLAAGMMLLVGDRPAALLATNAFFGTLSVLILYVLGALLINRKAAVIASLLLAFSPYHLIYSRSALADATAVFFILAGVLAWAWARMTPRTRSIRYGLAGIAFGYAATCHYRALYIPALLFLLEFVEAVFRIGPRANQQSTERKRRVPTTPQTFPIQEQPLPARRDWGSNNAERGRAILVRWSWILAGLLVPPFAIETIFRGGRLIAWITDSHLPLRTFFEGASWWLQMEWRTAHAGATEAVHWWKSPIPAAYFNYFLHWHGFLAVGLALLGVILALIKKNGSRVVALLIIVPLVLLMFQGWTVARAMAGTIPFVCLAIAMGVVWASEFLGRAVPKVKPVAFILLTALSLVPSMTRSLELYSSRSDIEKAVAWLSSRIEPSVGAAAVAVPSRKIYTVYGERNGLRVVHGLDFQCTGTPGDVLEMLANSGVRWLVCDPQIWHHQPSDPIFQWWTKACSELAAVAPPIAEFAHLKNDRYAFLAEGPGIKYLANMESADGGPIRIYELPTPSAVAVLDSQ